MTLQISHVSYVFLSLLPAREVLVSRGRRLQDTPHQRQNKVYAPDNVVKVEVEDAAQRLSAQFSDDSQLVLYHGECRKMRIWLSNIGTQAIGEIWLVGAEDDEFWFEESGDHETGTPRMRPLLRFPCSTSYGRSFCTWFQDLRFGQLPTPQNALQNSVDFRGRHGTCSGC